MRVSGGAGFLKLMNEYIVSVEMVRLSALALIQNRVAERVQILNPGTSCIRLVRDATENRGPVPRSNTFLVRTYLSPNPRGELT